MAKSERGVRQKPRFDALILTCEHGGNHIPPAYAKLFRGATKVLNTHRGLDIGALPVAKLMARQLDLPLHYVTVSRLLVDLNRSLKHPRAFSEYTRHLPREVRLEIAALYYHPHRSAVESWIDAQVALKRRVLHLGIHSFTPELHGIERNAEIGILYDSKHRHELEFALDLQTHLESHIESNALSWRVRRNYPYNGAADGFTTALRRRLPERSYLGVEIELNQAIVGTPAGQKRMAQALVTALVRV